MSKVLCNQADDVNNPEKDVIILEERQAYFRCSTFKEGLRKRKLANNKTHQDMFATYFKTGGTSPLGPPNLEENSYQKK